MPGNYFTSVPILALFPDSPEEIDKCLRRPRVGEKRWWLCIPLRLHLLPLLPTSHRDVSRPLRKPLEKMARTLWNLVLLVALPGLSSAALPTVVGDSCNQYAGTANVTTGVTKWLGIRYAAPPVGDLRFMPPQDAPCQTGVQNATQVSSFPRLILRRSPACASSECMRWLTKHTARADMHRDWRYRECHSLGRLSFPRRLRAVQCHIHLQAPGRHVHPGWRLQQELQL